jgi:hypothetical protein
MHACNDRRPSVAIMNAVLNFLKIIPTFFVSSSNEHISSAWAKSNTRSSIVVKRIILTVGCFANKLMLSRFINLNNEIKIFSSKKMNFRVFALRRTCIGTRTTTVPVLASSTFQISTGSNDTGSNKPYTSRTHDEHTLFDAFPKTPLN